VNRRELQQKRTEREPEQWRVLRWLTAIIHPNHLPALTM